jgi:hypothetical protein
VKRWLGEPIRTLIIPTKIFLSNKKGKKISEQLGIIKYCTIMQESGEVSMIDQSENLNFEKI